MCKTAQANGWQVRRFHAANVTQYRQVQQWQTMATFQIENFSRR